MKFIGCISLLFSSYPVFSQSPATKFIESKNIQWAAFSADTAHFSDPNLSLLLRNRFENDEIKAVTPNFSDISLPAKKSDIRYIKKENLLEYGDDHGVSFYDEAGNVVETPAQKRINLFSTEKFDARTNDMIELEQIFYIESGKLKNYIPSVSPKISIVTPGGTYLGISNVFTTALNFKRNIRHSTKKKAISLGSTNTIYSLKNDSRLKMLKQLYGQNLLAALWPHLDKKNYEINSIDAGGKLSKKDLKAALVPNAELIAIPIYDADGNISSDVVGPEVGPGYFSSIKITQQWFYNKKKNIVFCNIPSLTLYTFKLVEERKSAVETAVLKINLK